MKYKYVVILKPINHRSIDTLSFLLCCCTIAVFLITALRTRLTRDYIFFALATFIFAGLLYNIIARRRRSKPIAYRYFLGFAALGWFAMPVVPWIGLVFAVLIFFEAQAKHVIEIGFDVDCVVFNTFFSRRIYWSDLNNVILRDGLLTIDFKNNRLIQREIADDEEEDDADEEEFNAFCRDRLAAVGEK
jgi:hypothetical protein